MSIQVTAANVGTKNAAKLLKRLAEPLRVWLTKRAWKRQVKRDIKARGIVPLLALGLILVASGCSSFDAALIGTDRLAYGNKLNPYLNQVPAGWEARPYVVDAAANRVDVTGWQVRQELVQSDSWKPSMLNDVIAKPRPSSAVADAIQAITAEPAAPTADLDALQQQILDAAK